jgi:hypothetical protein
VTPTTAGTLATAGAERINATERPTAAQETAGASGDSNSKDIIEPVETPSTEARAGTPEM